MDRSLPITLNGKKKLETELDHLIRVEREKIKKALSDARALGDLSENADYQFAKERQSMSEGRILQLQGVLASSEVVDVANIRSNTIVFGATVTLRDTERDAQISYQIVGKDESDSVAGKISYTSPIGKALIGKKVGDSVVVKAPKGEIEYEIISFKFV